MTAHIDTFARDHLPPREAQPEFLFELPELQLPERLNCASELLDRHVREGRGERRCVSAPGGPAWTYAELQRQADRIAHVLVRDLGVVPGNRVLLRAANKPMLVACWFAVMKAGAIAVATMPMLRAKELGQMIEKARVTTALCDAALRGELDAAAALLHVAVEQLGGAVQALGELQLGQLEDERGLRLGRRQVVAGEGVDVGGGGHGSGSGGWRQGSRLAGGARARQSGITAVASISTRARSSISAVTSTAVIAAL
jgi:hypothetical protein